jgi:hypothetical protein
MSFECMSSQWADAPFPDPMPETELVAKITLTVNGKVTFVITDNLEIDLDDIPDLIPALSELE